MMMWVRAVTACSKQIFASIRVSNMVTLCCWCVVSSLSKASSEMLDMLMTMHCGLQHTCFAAASLVQTK